MRSIFIGSTGGHPGQTLSTWALAIKLKEKSLRVGFLKPFGVVKEGEPSGQQGGYCDADVALFKTVLRIEDPLGSLCPITLAENSRGEAAEENGDSFIDKIQRAFSEISSGKDVVLIMGAKEIFFGGDLSKLSDSLLVKMFNANVLLVDRYLRDNLTLYSLLSLNSFLEGRVKSAIINHVAPDHWDRVREKVVPFLKEKGIRSVIPIPENSTLAALTVDSITELIEGEIVCLPQLGGNVIETFTTGLRNLEGALSIFKKVYNKIVLVSLKQAPEEEKRIGGIVLTGGKIPSEIVCQVARERFIPLILTRLDTFQAMERLEQAKPSLGMKDEFKVRHFLKIIDQEMGANQWVETLL